MGLTRIEALGTLHYVLPGAASSSSSRRAWRLLPFPVHLVRVQCKQSEGGSSQHSRRYIHGLGIRTPTWRRALAVPQDTTTSNLQESAKARGHKSTEASYDAKQPTSTVGSPLTPDRRSCVLYMSPRPRASQTRTARDRQRRSASSTTSSCASGKTNLQTHH